MLLAVSERVLRSQACTDAYRSDFAAGDQICSLGVPIGNGQHASSCYGDSGGPVVGAGRRGSRLVGVVSFGGDRCGDPRDPSVSARVAPARDWIRSVSH